MTEQLVAHAALERAPIVGGVRPRRLFVRRMQRKSVIAFAMTLPLLLLIALLVLYPAVYSIRLAA